MQTFATVIAVVFAIIFAFVVSVGLDLRKWQSWLFGACGFLIFLLVGLVGTGNVIESIKVGAIVDFAIMFGEAMTRWNRERAKKWLREHYEEED